MVGVVVDTQVT